MGLESEAPAKNHRGIWSTSFVSPVGKERLKWVEAGLLRLHPALSSLSVRALHFLLSHNLDQHAGGSCLRLYQPRNDLTKGAPPMNLSLSHLFIFRMQPSPLLKKAHLLFFGFVFWWFFWLHHPQHVRAQFPKQGSNPHLKRIFYNCLLVIHHLSLT